MGLLAIPLIIWSALNFAGNATSVLGWLSIMPRDLAGLINPPQVSLTDVIKSAVVEGVNYTTAPTSETLVAKVITRASLDDPNSGADMPFLFSLVSPFKPTGMNTIFRGDGCRFLGKGRGISQDKNGGYIDIVGASCVDDRGIAYELHAQGTRRLGFVASVGDFASGTVKLIQDKGDHTLQHAENVMLRFDQPVALLLEAGRVR
ncbi:hypothetical protein [Pseudomonas sp. SW-3]|uniref:hypothetical protein n=1 Tax=Pseudomonas sp. SW-3 TaxID=147212 RepID=UPI00190913D8|nr:hypothetical protein [Pseudomonas sp. SW-3]QQO01691.1 hypothetical protein JIO00_14420 [Pseudomonas sp. SW-3]